MAVDFNLLKQSGPANFFEGLMQGQEEQRTNAMAQQRAMQAQQEFGMRQQEFAAGQAEKKRLSSAAIVLQKTASARDAMLRAPTSADARRIVEMQYADPDLSPVRSRFGSLAQALAEIPDDPNAFQQYKEQEAMGMEAFLKQQSGNRAFTSAMGGTPTAAPANAMYAQSEAYPGYNESIGMGAAPANAMAAAPTAPANAITTPVISNELQNSINQRTRLAALADQTPQVKATIDRLDKDIARLYIAPPAPTETNRLQAERTALIQSGVSPNDPRIQAYDQKLASGESQSAKLQRELQVAIANKAPAAHIAQLQRDIRNLHPGLAMQNIVGIGPDGNQIVTRLPGAGGGPAGQFGLNQAPQGLARAMLGLNEADSALLFGPGGPVESGQIPVNKLTASNARMYVAAMKANPTLNLTNLTEDQLLAASKAKTQGVVQGRQVLTLVDRSTAQNIANGNLPPLTGPNSTKIMNEVVGINPNFKASDYGLQTQAVKAFNQSVLGNKTRSLNVVKEHFKTLEKSADALQSGDVRATTAIAQFIQTQTGKPAPATFNAVKEILADEIVAAVVPGVGALADRVAIKKTILAAASPAQLKGVVSAYKELIDGQLLGLEKQYQAGTGRSDFKSRYLISEAVQGLAPSSQYVETKVVNGRTLGKKADGTVEEIK